jgi:hypothetical protein
MTLNPKLETLDALTLILSGPSDHIQNYLLGFEGARNQFVFVREINGQLQIFRRYPLFKNWQTDLCRQFRAQSGPFNYRAPSTFTIATNGIDAPIYGAHKTF